MNAKYRVKESWIFNLESMHDKLCCIIYDIEDGKLSFPLTICGDVCETESDIYELMEEASNLELKAKTGAVTGSEYGRIKAIVNWRVEQRYIANVNAGNAHAGECFADL